MPLFQRLVCTQKYTIGITETVLIREVSLFSDLSFERGSTVVNTVYMYKHYVVSYIHVYMYMYVRMCTCMYACVHVRVYVCVCCTHMCMRTCTCMYVHCTSTILQVHIQALHVQVQQVVHVYKHYNKFQEYYYTRTQLCKFWAPHTSTTGVYFN